jgi:hypothetical protein
MVKDSNQAAGGIDAVQAATHPHRMAHRMDMAAASLL